MKKNQEAPRARPVGKVSVEEMEKVLESGNWYYYVSQAKDWAEENDRDLGMVPMKDKYTRGHPRKYYDAQALLDWWKEEKQTQAIKGGVEKWISVKERLEHFAKEKN